MLQINHVNKSFEATVALNDVTLNIEKGEFFGLLGPNGAGKTTLLNIIIGYLTPEAGHIAIDDEVLVYTELGIRKKFGYVPQDIALYLELSAERNLKIFGNIYGISGKQLNKKIDEVLELVQLNERRKDKVREFSGGMKRRLNLAASLLHDPEILLCDEPTVGVDPQSRNAIFDMLTELNRNGKTIIYTTHYMEEAERLCSRLAIIDRGEIIAEGGLKDLINLLDKKETVKIIKTTDVLNQKEELEQIGVVNEFDDYLELIPQNKFKKISQLFLKLEEMNIPEEAIELSRASLEDVFLHLTGRRLRD